MSTAVHAAEEQTCKVMVSRGYAAPLKRDLMTLAGYERLESLSKASKRAVLQSNSYGVQGMSCRIRTEYYEHRTHACCRPKPSIGSQTYRREHWHIRLQRLPKSLW